MLRGMAQGRDSPTGYDWEGSAVPSEPGPLVLPEPADETPPGAPSFADEQQGPIDEDRRRRGALPAWAIVAIVLVQASALVATVGLVMGGLQRLGGEGPPPPAATAPTEEPTESETASGDREPGTVTDSAGREVGDGTGGYDQPATIGEHTVSWATWTDGTLAVTAQEVDLAATAPGADGQDIAQDGYRLVLATYEVRYDGPGQLAPAEELWLTGESDRTYFPDIAEGLVPDPMKRISPLGSGESEIFHSAFLVPEAEIDSFRLGVETFSGEILYFAT